MVDYHQARWTEDGEYLEPPIFCRGGKNEESSEDIDLPQEPDLPDELVRGDLEIPDLSRLEVVRHFTRLSQMNYGIDSGICPLGSCTMKYNPKFSEGISSLDEARFLHPDQPEETVQGSLEIMYRLEKMLSEISGMERVSFQPSAGAHGEFLAMLIVRAFHQSKGEEEKRTEVIVPDSAHGTNPASAAMAGYKVVEIPSDDRGRIDLELLESAVSERTAALMLTNPNTLGLFEDNIGEIVDIVHEAGGLLFYDGANLNGIIGKIRPGDMGFDIVQFNLHKTFAAPHSGGGPGAGPLGVKEELVDFLPAPLVDYDEDEDRYRLIEGDSKGVGKIQSYHGNFTVLLKAYAYLVSLGSSGLKEVSETAVLNANYIREKLSEFDGLELRGDPDSPCKHETVFSAEPLKIEGGVTAKDVSKRLMDYGVQAPTDNFPPIVPEALMIEPTETEPLGEIDRFIEIVKKVLDESNEDPSKLLSAPHRTSIGRIDESRASEKPILSWKMYIGDEDEDARE